MDSSLKEFIVFMVICFFLHVILTLNLLSLEHLVEFGLAFVLAKQVVSEANKDKK